MRKKYYILLLFMVIFRKPVHSVDNETNIATVESTSDETYTDESTSNSYGNTTETNERSANETESFDETTSYDTNTTLEIPSTKRPVILPKLPEAFQARVRLSRTSHPASAYNVFVSYDLKKNRAAITKEDSKNKNRQIYDFKLNRILDIKGTSCLVENISENSTEDLEFPFPFSIINGEKQMNEPLSIFRLDGDDVEMNREQIFVSGVPCTEYFKTIKMGYMDECRGDVQCKIRQFFSNSEWKNPNCKDVYCSPMPIRIDVECGYNPGSCYYLHVTFSFLEYYEEIRDEEEFQQLPGVYCENATAVQFPILSSSFRATLMEKDVLENTQRKRKVWWSEALNVLRVDEIVDDTDEVSLITDYNTNISYTITKLDTECYTKLLDQEKPSTLSLITGSKKEDVKGIQKTGKRRCELSECEVWTGETVSGESFDIYLNSQNSSNEDDPTPVFVYLFRKNEVLELYSHKKLTSYVSALGEWSAFDVAPCFADISNTHFELTIIGDIGEKWKNPSFRENVYNTIWNYSRLISPLRLQNFQIIPETNETIIVKGMIMDITKNKFGSSYKDISSRDALENIAAVSSEENVFTGDKGLQLKVTDFKIKKVTPKTDGKKYGPGDMGGLAAGMIIVGIILGTSLVFIIKKMNRR